MAVSQSDALLVKQKCQNRLRQRAGDSIADLGFWIWDLPFA
ncbi:MAG TPA: hypothetical protein VK892_23905 [Pyrinomonadaceae bacterium]|nr:hypothetical protein [Pyrinomonadaceae bacterium]